MALISKRKPLFVLVSALAFAGCVEEADPQTDGNTPGFGVVIRADSNRDGQVDLAGQSDEVDKLELSKARGALFLPNLDDDASRCAGQAKPGDCFDAADEVVNGPEDARDLARVKTLPLEVSQDAIATLTLVSKKQDAVRLFHEQAPGQFVAIASGHRFTPEQVRAGLHLAVEGKVPAMDAAVWDGRIELHYEVQDAGKRALNKVALSVAPLLTHTHADEIKHLIAAPSTVDPNAQNFRRDVDQAMTAEKFAPKHTYLKVGDEWAQDWVEPLYASIPGSDGPVSMHVLLGSDQERNEAYKALYTLRGPNVGVQLLSKGEVQALPDKSGSYSSFGNLETIPPHPGYPAGRQVFGGNREKTEGPSKKTLAFLNAQGVQDPIWLDSSWLEVGHVDEFVSFIPDKNATLGFKIVIVDPLLALELLKDAAENGHGDVIVNSYKPVTESEKAVADGNAVDYKTTIRQFLDNAKEVETQNQVAKLIAANLEILKAHTQIPDQDILRLPGLFKREELTPLPDDLPDDLPGLGDLGWSLSPLHAEIQDIVAKHPHKVRPYGRLLAGLPAKRRLQFLRKLTAPEPRNAKPAQKESSYVYSARIPDVVNMVVSPKGLVLAPKQFGPVVDGKDIFAAKIQEQLGSSGFRAHFVDDYVTYHLAGGEVHCGSNTIREPRAKWWATTPDGGQ